MYLIVHYNAANEDGLAVRKKSVDNKNTIQSLNSTKTVSDNREFKFLS